MKNHQKSALDQNHQEEIWCTLAHLRMHTWAQVHAWKLWMSRDHPDFHLPLLRACYMCILRKPDQVRRLLSSCFFVMHLQCTSSWHFQSGLALTKTIACFALKRWITWNGNLAAKPWKIVPGPNICPQWAQLRSPRRRSRMLRWESSERGREKWRQWPGSGSLSSREVFCSSCWNTLNHSSLVHPDSRKRYRIQLTT